MKEQLLNEWLKLNVELNACIEKLNSLKQEREEILNATLKEPTSELLDKMMESEQNFVKIHVQSEALKEKSIKLQKELKSNSLKLEPKTKKTSKTK